MKHTPKDNVISIADARRFRWKMSNDSMLAAGIRAGRYYWFRRTSMWRDGDIAAVTTPHGHHYICYLRNMPAGTVALTWGHDSYRPQYFSRAALRVRGVMPYAVNVDLEVA